MHPTNFSQVQQYEEEFLIKKSVTLIYQFTEKPK